MNKYELCVVLNAKIEDEVRTAELEKVKELISRFGGNVTDVEEWGKKRLAYEIQKMKEGYYFFINFEASTEAGTIVEVEQRLRITESVLRFLCVKKEA